MNTCMYNEPLLASDFGVGNVADLVREPSPFGPDVQSLYTISVSFQNNALSSSNSSNLSC